MLLFALLIASLAQISNYKSCKSIHLSQNKRFFYPIQCKQFIFIYDCGMKYDIDLQEINTNCMRFLKVALLIAIITPFISHGQTKKQFMSKYSSVGFGGGSSHYFGDLAGYKRPLLGLATMPRWNGTVQYTRYLSPRLMMRTGFSWIRISGDDFTYSTKRDGTLRAGLESKFFRNAHFRNDIKEFSATALYNLRPQYNRSANQRDRVMPYVFAGIGLYAHDPQARVRFTEFVADPADPTKPKPTWTSLSDKSTGGQGQGVNYPTNYSTVALVMPVGFGVRLRLAENIDITFEGGLRITPNDYLDDIGGDYANPIDLGNVDANAIPIPANMLPGSPSPTTATLSQILSNRTLEKIAARTGKDRTTAYNAVIGGTAPAGAYFFDPSTQKIGYKADGTLISGSRFSKYWDSYAVIQVSLHFLLNSSAAKCPPIK